jgi:hypothetical protein
VSIDSLGPSAAPGVTLTAVLAAAMTPLVLPGPCVLGAGIITCQWPRLEASQRQTIQIPVRLDQPGLQSLYLNVAGAVADPDEENNHLRLDLIVDGQVHFFPMVWGNSAAGR